MLGQRVCIHICTTCYSRAHRDVRRLCSRALMEGSTTYICAGSSGVRRRRQRRPSRSPFPARFLAAAPGGGRRVATCCRPRPSPRRVRAPNIYSYVELGSRDDEIGSMGRLCSRAQCTWRAGRDARKEGSRDNEKMEKLGVGMTTCWELMPLAPLYLAPARAPSACSPAFSQNSHHLQIPIAVFRFLHPGRRLLVGIAFGSDAAGKFLGPAPATRSDAPCGEGFQAALRAPTRSAPT